MQKDKKNSKYIEEKLRVNKYGEKYSFSLLGLKLLWFRQNRKLGVHNGQSSGCWAGVGISDTGLWTSNEHCSQDSLLILIIEICRPSPSLQSCLLQPGSCFQLLLVHQSITLIFLQHEVFLTSSLIIPSFRAKQSFPVCHSLDCL